METMDMLLDTINRGEILAKTIGLSPETVSELECICSQIVKGIVSNGLFYRYPKSQLNDYDKNEPLWEHFNVLADAVRRGDWYLVGLVIVTIERRIMGVRMGKRRNR